MKRAIYAIPTSTLLLLTGCGAVCGDGTVDEGEECDDGNAVDTDSCPSSCVNAACGDSFVQNGVEECDDGNNIDEDACTNVCENAECGDGILFTQAGGVEECDDGNNNDTDSCPSTCENAVCGDGFVQSGVEGCDDSNQNNNDGCTNVCDLDPVIQNFEITRRANANLVDANDAYFYCGFYCTAICDETFNTSVVVAANLSISGSYDRDRVCTNANYSNSTTYNVSGAASVVTSGAQYDISLAGGAQAIELDCTMDAASILTCRDGNNAEWILTPQ
jgi:cysteine-rich repeat protein